MKLMLFGDSHIASHKRARKLVDVPEGIDLKFWGTRAAIFRRLCWRDGAVHPTDDEARKHFAAYSNGLTNVDPKDYDVVVFVSTRIRLGHILPDLLNVTTDTKRHFSRKYLKSVILERFEGFLTFPFAKNMAKTDTKIWLSLSPLDTYGRVPTLPEHARALQAEHHDVQEVWDLIEEVLADHDIGFIPQPLHTITNGYFTDSKYGVDAQRDYLHKNVDFGQVMLSETLSFVTGS